MRRLETYRLVRQGLGAQLLEGGAEGEPEWGGQGPRQRLELRLLLGPTHRLTTKSYRRGWSDLEQEYQLERFQIPYSLAWKLGMSFVSAQPPLICA